MELDYIKIKTENDGIMYGGCQNLFGEKVRKSGCGMIAVCDMLLFLQGKTAEPETMEEYRKYAESFRDNVAYKRRKNLIGISPFRAAKMLSEHSCGRKFRFYSKIKFTRHKLSEYIKFSLENGLPVIVRIGANGKKLPYDIVYPASNRHAQGKMTWHYITVTGISEDTLVFSSWGGKGTMLLTDLHRHFGFSGGIISDVNLYKKFLANFKK